MIFCNVRIYLAVRQARSRIAPSSLRDPSERAVTRIEFQSTHSTVDGRLRDDNATSSNRENDLATISATVAVRRNAEARGGEREARIFRSLSYIVAAYLVLWTPTHIAVDVNYHDASLLSDDIVNYVSILCYLNSAINPVLYAASCELTRQAMRRVIRCNRP